jgi:hypothetical protein
MPVELEDYFRFSGLVLVVTYLLAIFYDYLASSYYKLIVYENMTSFKLNWTAPPASCLEPRFVVNVGFEINCFSVSFLFNNSPLVNGFFKRSFALDPGV